MAPSNIPAPLPPWAKALLQIAPLIDVGLQAALEYIGTIDDSSNASPDEWRHIQLVGGPVAAHSAADKFVTTLDIVNITGGGVDSSWTQGDHDAVAGQLGTLCQSWGANMSSVYRWYEMRFYRAQFNPYSVVTPFTKSGAPVAVYPLTTTGQAANGQAPQVAFTSTDRTAYAKHWGRNYWPMPGGGALVSGQYAAPSLVTAWATAMQTTYNALMAAEYFPVVVTTQVDRQPVRGLLTVDSVQVDNLFDVIRRRRPKLPTQRVALPV